MKNYLELMQDVVNNGITRGDRTGTGTRSVFGRQLRFDLNKGFPLVTTKHVHLKSVISELLWFLNGNPNNYELNKVGCRIWNEWATPNGYLGPVYGHAWRYCPDFNNPTPVLIKIRKDEYADYVFTTPALIPSIECDLNTDLMWAIEVVQTFPNTVYKVQTSTGYINTISRPNWRSLKNVTNFDGYLRTTANVGFLGTPLEQNERLYTLWRNMILRCYDTNHSQYKNYGAKGITVSPIWHSYEMFQKTISSVPFYYLWVENTEIKVELDKDYFGSSVYSPNTTIFLPHSINTGINNGTLLSIKGKSYLSWTDFEQSTGIRFDYLKAQLAKGKTCKGIKPDDVQILQPLEGYNWRKTVFIDQIENLIDQIKTNPNSRRLIVSGWVPELIEHQALPPCHTLFQFYVSDGKLSCQLYQRSADLFLGVPFNIASYALLTHMIAQQCDLEVGDFVHTFGDCHLYNNHITDDIVYEQLSREPLPLPKLKILRKPDSIFDYKLEDFAFEGYVSHPKISAPISV